MADDTESLPDVARRVGITYRQADYWLRTGRYHLDTDATGSGHYRRVHPAEAAALADLVERIRLLERIRTEIDTGTYYTRRLHHHLNRDEQDPT